MQKKWRKKNYQKPDETFSKMVELKLNISIIILDFSGLHTSIKSQILSDQINKFQLYIETQIKSA